eukprot:1299035-Rhodomonas_salina.1
MFNPPTVEDISLPPRPLVGIPQRPVASLRSVDDSACVWQWFRGATSPEMEGGAEHASCVWTEIPGANSMRYAPQREDV